MRAHHSYEVNYPGKGGSFFVLLDGPKIIGTVALNHESDASCELWRMYLASNYRRRGLGRMLLGYRERLPTDKIRGSLHSDERDTCGGKLLDQILQLSDIDVPLERTIALDFQGFIRIDLEQSTAVELHPHPPATQVLRDLS